jgi:hypothetical protein
MTTNPKISDNVKYTIPPAWKCAQCRRKLPTRGNVWAWRYAKRPMTGDSSGYICDSCADAREAGIDY